MIGRLRGILITKSPPWAMRHVCEPLPRMALSARPWMAGQGDQRATQLRHGWPHQEAQS
jgi:hypothetical protein